MMHQKDHLLTAKISKMMNKPENRPKNGHAINMVDSPLNKGQQPKGQRKNDLPRKTNESDKTGTQADDEHISSSNKDGGPAGENL